MTVKERLMHFLKHESISQKKFAQAVGLSDGYVNAIRVSIQPDTAHRIAACFPSLNIGWLLTGEGEMLKGDKQSFGDIANSTIVGANVNGNGNKITHYASEYDVCKKEVDHLMAIIAEKDKVIAEKERLITILLKTNV